MLNNDGNTLEFEYTRDCLAVELYDGLTLPVPPEELDFYSWLNYLQSQRLAAHFYTLSKKYDHIWPISFREELRRVRYANLLYGDRCFDQVNSLLNVMKKAEISVIVLKGWAFIQTLYCGDYGQRFCEDIDILVDPQDVSLTEKLIISLGYKGVHEVWPGFTHRYNNARAFTYPLKGNELTKNLDIGLHWGLFRIPAYDPNLIDVASIFKRAQKLRIGSYEVLQLCPEDQIVYTCAHLRLHHRKTTTLSMYYEIARLFLHEHKSLDWFKLIDRAALWQVKLQVKYVISMINELWAGIVPHEGLVAFDSIKISFLEKRMDNLIEAAANSRAMDTLLTTFALPSIPKKFSFLIEQAFPSPNFIKNRYKLRGLNKISKGYFRRFGLALISLFHKE